jgi:hypothetical protein
MTDVPRDVGQLTIVDIGEALPRPLLPLPIGLAQSLAHLLAQPLVSRVQVESGVPPLGVLDAGELGRRLDRGDALKVDRCR